MAYPISDVTRRVVYTGSAGVGPYSFTFEVLANTDIQVYKNTTLLTLTTNYTVTINANGTGSVTLVVAATGTDTITIVGDRAIQRATDFVTGGDLFANTLNDEFDSLVIFAQQVDEKADRGLKAPVTDPTDVNMVLPVKASRKGKVLAFDSTSGDPVAGPALDAVTTVIAQSANINTVATNIASVNTVAGNNTNVTTVAGVSGAVTTVAGISANVTSVAGNSSNINTVAGISANVTTVAGISANVTTVAGISANVTSVAGNSTNINAVASNATNINAVNANATNINTVAGVNAAVTTVATNIASVNTAATNIAAIIDAPNQATAAANSATAAAASAAAGMYSAVQDKSANYTVVAGDAGDLIRVTTTSGAITITLPTISTVGDGFKVAIVKWTGDANAVNVVRSSTNTINGATSATIGSQYSSTIFVADFETDQWFAASSGLGATNIAVDAFSGNNSTLAFTLSTDPGSENNTQVYVSGVYQEKDTYSVSGTTLTFSTAPPTGTSNIEVVSSAPLAIGTPSDGTVTTAKLASTTGSGAVVLATSPTLVTPVLGAASATSITVAAGAVGTPSITTSGDTNTGIFFPAADTIAFAEGGAEAMRIDSSGNVGIGTSSPAAMSSNNGLQVGTQTIVQSIVNTQTLFSGNAYYNGSTWKAVRTQSGYAALRFGAIGAGGISFHSNSAAYTAGDTLTNMDGSDIRMVIDTSGNLLVGATSGSTHIIQKSSASSTVLSITNTSGTSPSGAVFNFSAAAPNNGTQTFWTASDTGGYRGGFLSNGGLQNYQGNNSNLSDQREKKNIQLAPNYLDKICQIPVKTFLFNDQTDTELNLGSIAQDVQAVCPELITESNWGTEEEPKMRLSIYQTDLQYALMKSIQELKAINDTQAETINALTARVVALEGN
jgi:hypothetical protein